MSTSVILILMMAVVAILVIAIASRRGGPRVTEITRTVERDEDGEK
jgi:hypothetical protein